MGSLTSKHDISLTSAMSVLPPSLITRTTQSHPHFLLFPSPSSGTQPIIYRSVAVIDQKDELWQWRYRTCGRLDRLFYDYVIAMMSVNPGSTTASTNYTSTNQYKLLTTTSTTGVAFHSVSICCYVLVFTRRWLRYVWVYAVANLSVVVCRLSSVVVVWNVRAPYLAG